MFDLDGTLIDSAPGIIDSFLFAFVQVYGIECSRDIKSLIGPPINEILFEVNGESDPFTINKFVEIFKKHYDTLGFKKSKLFENVFEVLKLLFNSNVGLYIVTNKRNVPTGLILEHLKIKNFFNEVYCIDSFKSSYDNKSKLVQNMLFSFNLEISSSLFVGDTIHDEHAASINGLDFVFVEYGYGSYIKPTFKIDNIVKILKIIE